VFPFNCVYVKEAAEVVKHRHILFPLAVAAVLLNMLRASVKHFS